MPDDSPNRIGEDAVERLIIPQIVSAIHPVLIPIEQQDVAIQARNRERLLMAARAAWRAFATATP